MAGDVEAANCDIGNPQEATSQSEKPFPPKVEQVEPSDPRHPEPPADEPEIMPKSPPPKGQAVMNSWLTPQTFGPTCYWFSVGSLKL